MSEPTTFDAIIVGGGPAGLAVAQTFQEEGLRCVVIEKGPVANHISQYPHFMRFFSTNENLEIAGFPLQNDEDKPSRRDYLLYLTAFAKFHKLNVENYTEVTSVARGADGVFDVVTQRPSGENDTLRAKTVIMAVGAFEDPRQLDCPGADLSKVIYRFSEPHAFVGQKVLVVGGRNSAIEIALLLFRSGAQVSLSYRRDEFRGRGVKYWLRPDIDNRLANNEIEGHLGTNVTSVGWDSVELTTNNGESYEIENDFVIPCLGYDPPVSFLRSAGIDLAADGNVPSHDEETLETNVPGLFVCGTIVAGNISGSVFIENSRHHGTMMLPRVKEILSGQQTEAASR